MKADWTLYDNTGFAFPLNKSKHLALMTTVPVDTQLENQSLTCVFKNMWFPYKNRVS